MTSAIDAQCEVRAEVQAALGEALNNLSLDESARLIQETRLAELNTRGAPLIERMQDYFLAR